MSVMGPTCTSKRERIGSMASGIPFYPSTSVGSNLGMGISELEDDALELQRQQQRAQVQLQQSPYSLDPTAIFKKGGDANANRMAPEQSITLFALRLAILEKSASGIGTLAFIWASTIILGGFASDIGPVDFVVIAVILVTEGTRIFSRSRQLEWQHLAAKSTDISQTMYVKPRGRLSLNNLRHGGWDRMRTTSRIETMTSNIPLAPTQSFAAPGSEGGKLEPAVRTADGSASNSQQDSNVAGSGNFKVKLGRAGTYCLRSLSSRLRGRFSDEQDTGVKSDPMDPTTGREDLEMGSSSGRAPGRSNGITPTSRTLSSLGNISRSSKISVNLTVQCSKDHKFSLEDIKGTIRNDITQGVASPSSSEVSEMDLTKNVNGLNAKNIKRTWSSELVPVIPGPTSALSTKGVSAILFWVQLTSAIICFILSSWRIWMQTYNPDHVNKNDSPVNLYMSINLFYVLALLEASMFLLERSYWEYMVNYAQLIVQVNNKAGLGEIGQEVMKQFFYEVYKKCIEGSVLDGLEMDLVEFSLTLLQSDSTLEQLGGLRVLRKIVDRYDGFSVDALRRIGTAPGVIERLVEMLSWGSPHHGDVRHEVAALFCRTVRYSKNCVRIAAVPAAMEGIVSLIKSPERDRLATSLIDRSMTAQLPASVDHTADLRLDGLRILVAQARDAMNLLKIGETRGLLPLLVSLITVKDVKEFQTMEGKKMKTFKKVLRLLSMLMASRNADGSILRPAFAHIVSGIASLGFILEFGDSHPQLQWITIEILTHLALDDDIRRAIGSTGGVIRNLFTLFTRSVNTSESLAEEDRNTQKAVSRRAGAALNILTIQNRRNCLRMMDLQQDGKKTFIPVLLGLLSDRHDQTFCAAKILRSIVQYGDEVQKREIATCAPRLMKLVMRTQSQKMQEAVTGLAPRVLEFIDDTVYNNVFKNVDRTTLVSKLMKNLEFDTYKMYSYPKLRRHSIEFILALVKRDAGFAREFTRGGMLETKLVQTLDTCCELENFVIFSGTEGLTRHDIDMEDFVQRSLDEARSFLTRDQDENTFSTSDRVCTWRSPVTHTSFTLVGNSLEGAV